MPPPCPFALPVALASAIASLAAQDSPRVARTACADLLRATMAESGSHPVAVVLQAVFAAKHPDRQPASPKAVAQALAAGDALVEFVQWPDRDGDRLTAFVIGPAGRIERIELGPAAEIQLAVAAHLRLLTRWQKPLDPASKRLGELTSQRVRNLVLAPIEPFLAGCQRVWFAADGALSPLPFESLPASNASLFLLEAIDVRRLHCGTELLVDVPACGQSLLVVDGSATDLPLATREAQAVARAWETSGRQPQLRRASESGPIEAALRDRGFVHFATTAEFVRNGGRLPLRTQIVDASATATPPFPADLTRCRLVVVSGCGANADDPLPGRSQVKLRRILRHAGAHTVATTCWPVDDQVLCEWLEKFWQGLRSEEDPADAGRRMKLAWLENNRRVHLDPLPGTWAAIAFEGR
jgi:CHAT domain-containing protein